MNTGSSSKSVLPSCERICVLCGYLDVDAPADPLPGDPLRRPSDAALVGENRCPACASTAWADSRLEATAQLMRGVDSASVAEVESSFARVSLAVMRAIGSLVISGFVIVALDVSASGRAYLYMVALLLAVAIVIKGVFAPPNDKGRTLAPVRWHLALPPPIALRGNAEGPARALSALLVAPLTGRPCIAYEVGVRGDRNLIGSFESWMLLEQRSCAFAVGTHTFGENTVRLDFRQRVLLERATIDSARLAAFLAKRAFSASDPSLVITESIIAPGTHASSRSITAELGDKHVLMPGVVVRPASEGR